MQQPEVIKQAAITDPEVSFVISAYNADEFIMETILSILTQSSPDFELVIIDDASTDQTLSICTAFEDPRITLLHLKEREFVSTARNIASRFVRAPWICIFDADDIMLPDTFAPYFKNITGHPEAECGYCALQFVDSKGRPMQHEMRNRFDFVKMIHTNIMPHPMSLIKTELFLNVGGYDDSLPHSVDYDLWLKVIEWTTPAFYNHYGVAYRRHDRCIGNNNTGHSRVHELMRKRIEQPHHNPTVQYRRKLIQHILLFWQAVEQKDDHGVVLQTQHINRLEAGSFVLDHFYTKALLNTGHYAEAQTICTHWIDFMIQGGFLGAAEACTLAEMSLKTGIAGGHAQWLCSKALPVSKFIQQHMNSPSLATALSQAQQVASAHTP